MDNCTCDQVTSLVKNLAQVKEENQGWQMLIAALVSVHMLQYFIAGAVAMYYYVFKEDLNAHPDHHDEDDEEDNHDDVEHGIELSTMDQPPRYVRGNLAITLQNEIH
ncbi:hypothetical protein O1611_g9869 [Lasiodiplodia mahajangana]|uniref:Uncharacterized protein n=1 Tax=Lasiodiplodia mahajangana TaxID=1108764 RepID=A0ACC2J4K4_9PEZI|nr:hypothetical protein O1611_g9869 [Lasiodiplodia mahajangana]